MDVGTLLWRMKASWRVAILWKAIRRTSARSWFCLGSASRSLHPQRHGPQCPCHRRRRPVPQPQATSASLPPEHSLQQVSHLGMCWTSRLAGRKLRRHLTPGHSPLFSVKAARATPAGRWRGTRGKCHRPEDRRAAAVGAGAAICHSMPPRSSLATARRPAAHLPYLRIWSSEGFRGIRAYGT
jgi:hypothetical protein